MRAGDKTPERLENLVNSQGIKGRDVLLKPGISKSFQERGLSPVRPERGVGAMELEGE